MNKSYHNGPPKSILAFFRWFCRPEFREDIEGDLLERFESRKTSFGVQNARRLFVKDVLLLFRPGIVKNFHHQFSHLFLDMQRKDWIRLIVTCLCLTLIISLPFLPGPQVRAVVYLSTIAQVIGFFGLAFVPVGMLWVFAEFRRTQGKDILFGNTRLAFILAYLATLIFTVVAVLIGAVLFIEVSILAGIAYTITLIPVAMWTTSQLNKIRKPLITRFNKTPVYFMLIPLIACVARFYVAMPFSDSSRSIGIERGQSLISAIEEYHLDRGIYPDSLLQLVPDYITRIPKPGAIGIKGYDYHLTDVSYSLTFIQWVDMGTAQEIVRYNREGRYDIKGSFADFDAGYDHWRYFWLD